MFVIKIIIYIFGNLSDKGKYFQNPFMKELEKKQQIKNKNVIYRTELSLFTHLLVCCFNI